jgi:hypothetical protein
MCAQHEDDPGVQRPGRPALRRVASSHEAPASRAGEALEDLAERLGDGSALLLTTDARFARATTAASDVEPLLVR